MHNLFNRRISTSNLCPRCSNNPETTSHIVWECYYTKQIWESLHYTWPTEIETGIFWEWLEWHFQNCSKSKHIEIAITIWAIWYSRNMLIHEGIQQEQSLVITFIKSHISELQQLSTQLSHPQTHSAVHWSPPQPPDAKINFDASFSPHQSKSWSGLIVRNSLGEILGSAYRMGFHISSPFEAEAQALIHGLEFAKDLGFLSVEVEGDARTVIKKMNETSLDRSRIRSFIIDAKQMAQGFHRCRFTFTGRNGNAVARAMAVLGRRDTEDRFWVDKAPPAATTAADSDRRYIDPP
ncbi:hypothetical protein like AT3G25270 [Hibiscus trionum]|uniref:RNase H type-1 domain-containing protein n=1 Tax=Hibiscus trionum TaxID=183268 RepID=A0A9W7LN15_HIBTR|nr:hypothetical protein like AT3G25270 [Hibiscus trionum]